MVSFVVKSSEGPQLRNPHNSQDQGFIVNFTHTFPSWRAATSDPKAGRQTFQISEVLGFPRVWTRGFVPLERNQAKLFTLVLVSSDVADRPWYLKAGVEFLG